MSFFLCRCATLYPSPRQTTCVPLRFCKIKKKKKKKKTVETWVKISKKKKEKKQPRGNMGKKYQKLCHYPHTPFSGKGREALRQKVPVHRPNKTRLWLCTFFDSPSSKTTCRNYQISFSI